MTQKDTSYLLNAASQKPELLTFGDNFMREYQRRRADFEAGCLKIAREAEEGCKKNTNPQSLTEALADRVVAFINDFMQNSSASDCRSTRETQLEGPLESQISSIVVRGMNLNVTLQEIKQEIIRECPSVFEKIINPPLAVVFDGGLTKNPTILIDSSKVPIDLQHVGGDEFGCPKLQPLSERVSSGTYSINNPKRDPLRPDGTGFAIGGKPEDNT